MHNEAIQYLPLEKITANEQARKHFDEESIRGMMLSLLEVGQLQPVRVRKSGDKYIVVDGERRLRAARLAQWKILACIVEEKDLDEAAVNHRQLVANCQRENLTAWETAQAIDLLMQQALWSAAETAAKLGLSEATVSKLRGLLELPKEIQRKVESGEVPASTAYELKKIDDPARQIELATEVAAGRLTRDQLSSVVRKNRSTNQGQNAKPSSRAVVALGEERCITVSGNGLTLELLITWLEETLSKARKARTQGLALSTFVKISRDQSKTKPE